MTFYKYSGAGNDFIVLDGRIEKDFSLSPDGILELCSRKSGCKAADGRTGADGLMILSASDSCDFRMQFFNPDGSTGMMCGNGGRCITAFAYFLGIGGGRKSFIFEAADGVHSAEIIAVQGNVLTVRLKMSEPCGFREYEDGWFVNTGARHFVKFVDDVESADVVNEGSTIRRDARFAPEGVNVDFVQRTGGGELKIRTFEKGVEAETLACGTGITAAAAVEHHIGNPSEHYLIHARIADLYVDFLQSGTYLTGPAEMVI